MEGPQICYTKRGCNALLNTEVPLRSRKSTSISAECA